LSAQFSLPDKGGMMKADGRAASGSASSETGAAPDAGEDVDVHERYSGVHLEAGTGSVSGTVGSSGGPSVGRTLTHARALGASG
jgi:hypothetical protein